MDADLYPGQALQTARAVGLLLPRSRPVIAADWRPLWWAISEVGWVDDDLVGRLGRSQPVQDAEEVRRQLRRLYEVGWLTSEQGRGRPRRPLALTARGREVMECFPPHSPNWTTSAREVARRALAAVFRQAAGPVIAVEAVEEVLATGARWGRVVHERDVRMVLLQWRRDRLVRFVRPASGRWLCTELGHRALRSVARAAGEHLPRYPKRADQDHDHMLLRSVLQIADLCPNVVGVIRLARRTQLAGAESPWILPDGLVGFGTEAGLLVVALEIERRSRYPNLTRHIANYGQLAHQWPWCRIFVAVVTARVTAGRQAVLAEALETAVSSYPGILLTTVATTVAALPNRLANQGVQPESTVFAPPD
ncbi:MULTISPECIES: hypothetical protein [unclassified Crossiella]|uniref:hypothetical protein n=1 Tax=unclassified Crossiella TaxID=2620835 RepID=UPI001FFF60FC|nr:MULTISPECIES: hypothetical protein [unclassified Crossiella]MCK2240934.1 hypothetical protein [Crossiella sp. S99.2]MCK2253922.1 hypothetical protein [Crossiella sp. S99.1]